MSSLAQEFRNIKTALGGNREYTRYYANTGPTLEELNRITPLAPAQERIIAQLEFALKLSELRGGGFDGTIREALGFLAERLAEHGTVTKRDANRAEEILMPLAEAAKEYELIFAAHAHIDMNWMWPWHETVALALDTFRTMLSLMREYPDFCFSQSQCSVYKIVEEFEPSMMEEIKRRIAEGRWEVTASAWVETDKNMPSTESLCRHIQYSKKYMQEVWGIDPDELEVDFSPDTFGHSRNVAEIDNAGGVKYMYHCRGWDGRDPLYIWRAPSGRELLCYRELNWYNFGITPAIGAAGLDMASWVPGLNAALVVYGVGDHGGGPTRRDIEKIIGMNEWPVFPRLKFGTFREFFNKAEAVRNSLPVVNKELNFFADGCYTTQSRVKYGNRQAETSLYNAEALNALAAVRAGAAYCGKVYEQAWQNTLFTHFHDILTGSCVRGSREHAMGLYSHVLAQAQARKSQAMRAIAARIDTSAFINNEDISGTMSEGAGVGFGLEPFGFPKAEYGAGKRRIYHVFNPSAHERSEAVELTVWDWPGMRAQAEFTGADGRALAYQYVSKEDDAFWQHTFFKALVEVTIPPLGYTTVILNEKELERYPIHVEFEARTTPAHKHHILENDYLRVVIDQHTGGVSSFIDKATGAELIAPGEKAGFTLVECDGHSDSAWNIGRYISETPVTGNFFLREKHNGPLRQSVIFEATVRTSKITAEISLDKTSKALKYAVKVNWNELSIGKEPVPTLMFKAPLNYEANEYLFDIPGGSILRKPIHQDAPANTFCAAVNENGSSLAFACDCKYGYRGVDDSLTVTLIHPANNPDPDPERGEHLINLFLTVGADPATLHDTAFDAINACAYVSERAHAGDLPTQAPFLALREVGGCAISGVKLAEDGSGALIVRLYDINGKGGQAALETFQNIKSAEYVDLTESKQAAKAAPVVSGSAVTVGLRENELVTLKLTF